MKIVVPPLHFWVLAICLTCSTASHDKEKALLNAKQDSAQQVITLIENPSEEEVVIDENTLITPDGVQGVRLGEDITQISFPAHLTLQKKIVKPRPEEGGSISAYVLSNQQENLLEIYVDNQATNGNNSTSANEVSDIEILSERYKTAKGIGVGATLQEFVTAYPDYRIWYTYVSDRFVMETNKLNNAQFQVEASGYMGNQDKLYGADMVMLKAKDFEPES